jgi:hypothetical protein
MGSSNWVGRDGVRRPALGRRGNGAERGSKGLLGGEPFCRKERKEAKKGGRDGMGFARSREGAKEERGLLGWRGARVLGMARRSLAPPEGERRGEGADSLLTLSPTLQR